MRQPGQNRIAPIWFNPLNGLILDLHGLHLNLSDLPPLTERVAARRGANRMPRPGYRWSRRRGAMRFARLRKPAPCATGIPEVTGIRHELVSRVRREIDAGTYDDPAKLEAALERMFDTLSAE